ncbi:MAG: coproporphyrinogen III oxidase, partial [Nitrospirae bacterium]|nr:coproporphyrinogen III oxidase [Nitrospirota bacterium]
FLGLRKIRGIDLDWFKDRFHISLKDSHASRFAALEARDLLYTTDHRLRLTPRGILIADTITVSLI